MKTSLAQDTHTDQIYSFTSFNVRINYTTQSNTRLTKYCVTSVDNDLQMGEDRTYHSHIILSPEVYTSLCNMTSGERMRTYWRQGRGLRQGLYTCRSEVSRNNYINFCKPKYIFDSRTLLRYLEFLTFSQCCKC